MTTQEFLTRLLAHMGIEQVEIEVEEGEVITVQIKVSEEDSGLLIGYHGETLAALQKITQLVQRTALGEKKIVLNINDYKQRREQQLQEIVLRAAERVRTTQQPYLFHYLPANERLVIHQFVSQNEELLEFETHSEGEGDQRRLVMHLKISAPAPESEQHAE